MNPPQKNILIIENHTYRPENLAEFFRNPGIIEPVYRHVENDKDLDAALNERKWDLVLCDMDLAAKCQSALNGTAPVMLISPSNGTDQHQYPTDIYVKAFRASPDAIIISTVENSLILEVNDSYVRESGYSREELIGHSSFEFNIWVNLDDRTRMVKMLREQGFVKDFETTYRRKSGEIRFVQASVELIVVDGRNCLLMVVKDVTELKQAEAILRSSEKRYRQMFEFHGLPKLIIDPANGQILEANPAASNFYGYDLETLKTLNISDINLSSRSEIVAQLAQATSNQTNAFRFVHRLANGELRDVEVFSGPLEHEGRQLLYSTITDITEKEWAKTALEEANKLLEQRVAERTAELEKVNNRLEAIFNHSGDGILMVDTNQGIQQANYAFEKLFGIEPGSYTGQKLEHFVQTEESAKIESIIQEVAATHQKREVEVRAAGTGIDIEISLAPVNRSEKAVTNLVCIIRDISERKRAEAALQKTTAEVHDLYNNAPTGYHSLDSKGIIVQINDTELGWLGYSREEVLGKRRFTEFLTPESQAKFTSSFPIFLKQGWIHDLEFELIRKDGSIFPVLVNATATTDAAGNYLYSRSTLSDIANLKKAQQAVAEERNLLRTVIDAIPDFIYFKNTEHQIMLSNSAHARFLGTAAQNDSAGSKTAFDFYPFELANRFTGEEDHLFETGEGVLNSELLVTGKDGVGIWTRSTKIPLRNLKGEIIGLVGITHDITGLKTIEEALRMHEKQLRESEQMLQLVLDTIPVRVFWKDRDSIYLGCNQLFAADAGLAQNSDIIGKKDAELPWTRGQTENYRADDRDVIETGQPRLAYEENILTFDGSSKIIQTNKLPLRNYEGEVIGLLGAYTDITEQKRAEDELRVLSRRLRLAIEAGKIGTWEWDAQKDELYWDDQMLRFYGITREEVTGKTLGFWEPRTIHPDDLAYVQNEFAAALAGIKPLDVEFRIKVPTGEIRHLKGKAEFFRDATGNPVYIVGVNWDITLLKQAEENLLLALEQEKELGELKTRFVSMASHEFRTPLASILATTEMLTAYRDRMDQAQINARLDKIRQQVMHMKSIMDDVLQLARMQAGRVEFKPSLGDLNALCLEIIEEFASQPVNQGRIDYTATVAPVSLEFDHHLMRGVINNLISNALKYSPPEKSIEVELDLKDNQVILKVRDEGIGIPPEDLKHLFEPFHRGGQCRYYRRNRLGVEYCQAIGRNAWR